MTKIFMALLFMSSAISLNAQSKSNDQISRKITPESLVEEQLKAFNAKNFDAFVAPYSDSIELYNFPDSLTGKGKESLRGISNFFKQVPVLHCEIKSRIVLGNTVVDREHLTMSDGKHTGTQDYIVIYQIEGNKIKKMYTIK